MEYINNKIAQSYKANDKLLKLKNEKVITQIPNDSNFIVKVKGIIYYF